MRKVFVLRRFPYGGKYHGPGSVLSMKDKVAKVMVAIGKAEYYEGEQNVAPEIPDAAPAAIDYAAEHGVDLSLVTPTGSNGRILKRDVTGYLTRMMKA